MSGPELAAPAEGRMLSLHLMGSLTADRSAPPGRTVCCIFVATASLAIVVDLALVIYAPGAMTCVSRVPPRPPTTPPPSIPPLSVGGYAIGASFGVAEEKAMQAAAMMMVASLSALLSTVTAAFIVTFRPHKVPRDFEKKGTLSNVCQDVSTPWGRMFAVMLFIACLLGMISMYTVHIYENWFPWVNNVWEAWFQFYQPIHEAQLRIAWATIPCVGLMLTSLLPSLSDNSGSNIALSMVHNLAAPLSMAFTLVMETYQLAIGENAFAYFFCNEQANWYPGDLTYYQRLRVVVLCNTWLWVLIFLGVQVYLGLGSVLGLPIRTSYSLALVSFYGEITALVCIFFLPAIQSTFILSTDFRKDVLNRAGAFQQAVTAYNHRGNGTIGNIVI